MTSETRAALHEISSPKRFAGGITVRVVRAGWFRPDAGGFFGVVPKPLWSRFVTADERGRVLCRLNLLLVEADGHRLLVETGTGVRMSEKDRDIKGVEGGDPAEALHAARAVAKTRMSVMSAPRRSAKEFRFMRGCVLST